MSRIRTGAIAALNYNFISGLWVILSGIFSAPGTFLAIKNGLRLQLLLVHHNAQCQDEDDE